MRNEFFEAFIDEFGDATTSRYASVEEIEKWKGKLPELLLNYWRNEGWSSYYNGWRIQVRSATLSRLS
ncbi:GAD-like domain-containing protein [Providencia rettgeri]